MIGAAAPFSAGIQGSRSRISTPDSANLVAEDSEALPTPPPPLKTATLHGHALGGDTFRVGGEGHQHRIDLGTADAGRTAHDS